MDGRYEKLRLENQLCFPLYAASKEIVNRYKPVLSQIDLTYTQYIAMLVLWEHGTVSVKNMGHLLHLDSGTLTPVLKKLEQKGFIVRKRDTNDERILNVTLTEQGLALKDDALNVREKVACSLDITPEEAMFLYRILNKIISESE